MDVEHDQKGKRFVVKTEAGDAELSYNNERPGVLELDHTFVPDAARGRGLADALAEAALRYAREQKQKVVPACAFVKSWLSRHPEYDDLISD